MWLGKLGVKRKEEHRQPTQEARNPSGRAKRIFRLRSGWGTDDTSPTTSTIRNLLLFRQECYVFCSLLFLSLPFMCFHSQSAQYLTKFRRLQDPDLHQPCPEYWSHVFANSRGEILIAVFEDPGLFPLQFPLHLTCLYLWRPQEFGAST